MKTVRLEFYKLRHKKIFFMIILFLLFEMGWVFMSSATSMSRNPDSKDWNGIIMTVASLNGLFLPILTAVVVSRICDMEHKGNTWKMLMAASVSRGRIYISKYICVCTLLLIVGLVQVAAVVAFGLLYGLNGHVPISMLMIFLGGTLLTSMAVTALQQWISTVLKNQAFALCAGMLGGFAGMTAPLFPASIRNIFMWSYYTGLCPVTYSYSNNTMKFVANNIGTFMPAAVLLMGIAIFIAGSIHVSKKEV